MSGDLKEMKARLLAKKKPPLVPWDRGLSTGGSLLNLACSDRIGVGLLPGGCYLLVGDSSSGKSVLSMTILAEAALNKHYNNYQFIHDNIENGVLMDIRKFYGRKVEERLMPPKGTREDPTYSTTMESLYFHIDDVLEKGPAIYIVDSQDALTSDDEVDKFTEMKKAYEKGKEISGSYGTSKAKVNSAMMRKAHNKIRETGSILIIISQTRENIGFGSQFNPKTRSGGKAFTFYSQLEIWSSIKGHIKTHHKGKEREQGIYCQLHIKKNRLSGKDRKVVIPIYHSVGMDDTGSLVDYLVEEGHWPETKGKISATEFNFAGYREKVIEKIQEHELEAKLKQIVQDVWNGIEEAIKVPRRSRYV